MGTMKRRFKVKFALIILGLILSACSNYKIQYVKLYNLDSDSCIITDTDIIFGNEGYSFRTFSETLNFKIKIYQGSPVLKEITELDIIPIQDEIKIKRNQKEIFVKFRVINRTDEKFVVYLSRDSRESEIDVSGIETELIICNLEKNRDKITSSIYPNLFVKKGWKPNYDFRVNKIQFTQHTRNIKCAQKLLETKLIMNPFEEKIIEVRYSTIYFNNFYIPLYLTEKQYEIFFVFNYHDYGFEKSLEQYCYVNQNLPIKKGYKMTKPITLTVE
jgi:hypothetical protein